MMRSVTPRLATCLSLVLSLGPCAFAGETSDAITLQAKRARDKGTRICYGLFGLTSVAVPNLIVTPNRL